MKKKILSLILSLAVAFPCAEALFASAEAGGAPENAGTAAGTQISTEREFRVLSAERGSGLFAFAREHAGERITLALNCSEREAAFTPPGETLWSEGASGGMIGPYGFAVALSRG